MYRKHCPWKVANCGRTYMVEHVPACQRMKFSLLFMNNLLIYHVKDYKQQSVMAQSYNSSTLEA